MELDLDYFLTGSFDSKVRIWSVRNKRVVQWTQAQARVSSARFRPDGIMVVAGLMKQEEVNLFAIVCFCITNSRPSLLDDLSTQQPGWRIELARE